MLFRQFVDDDLGCASYLVGSTETAEALVVDPAYAIEVYIDEAASNGLASPASSRARPRRPRLGSRPAGPRARRARLRASARGAGVRVRRDRGRRRAAHGEGDAGCAAHARAPPRALMRYMVDDARLLTGDSLFVGDAARPDLAVERGGGRRGAVPQPPPPGAAPRRRRGVPGPRGRLALRRLAQPRALVDARAARGSGTAH